MGALFAATWAWPPSLYIAYAITFAGAAIFVLWIFLDCSFSTVAQMAAQDIRLQFLHDPHLRYWHRWKWYGPRLWAFAILAALSAAASTTVFIQLAFRADAERSIRNAVLAIAVLAVWIGLFAVYRKLWWMAFRRRIVRLQPAMKMAVDRLSEQWPEADVFLSGLGNYSVSSHDPDHLLHADPTPVPVLWETIGGISRKKDCCFRFGIESYLNFGAESFQRCCVEYRMGGYSPPERSATEVRSPPHTKTVRHEHDFPLGDSWYLAFYAIKLDFKDEVDPDLLEEIAKRPPKTRLPHRGGKFRSLADTEVGVWTLHWMPGQESPSPMFYEQHTLPKGQVVQLDYEPDPARSTHCTLMPEDRAGLEDRLVDSKDKKHRDYRGYQIQVSYIELDKNFEWLEALG
ncbi:MAG: hypothetical protein ABFC96_12465 [Thermoguttaceae bacterium]